MPQGSVLGPVLFLIYINDLEQGTEGLVEIIRKFADDTKLGNRAATAEDRAALQSALDRMCDWADKWGMAFKSKNVKSCM